MTLLADHVDEGVSQLALAELRSARRRNRLAHLDKFDAFYKAYVSALLSGVGLYAVSGAFGDTALTTSQLQSVRSFGPEWIGLLAAFVLAVGLRSGGRGGPMAFERADVRHILLAPVDRRETIRRPAMRQARHMVFVGAAAGAALGIVVARRMPEHPAAWVVSCGVFGVVLAVLAFGAAMVCGGYRIKTWIADVVGVAILGWSVLDIVTSRTTSPLTTIGSLPLWPLHVNATAAVGVVVAFGVLAWGTVVVNRSSIEAAERRSRLVGQLRFAATLQDVRTVMVLQRQLSQEQTRQRPWLTLPKPKSNGVTGDRVHLRVFLRRGLVGMLRWPMFRLVRLLFFCAVATAATFGVWMGTGPLVVVAGVAAWLAALDICEPLAQEIDRPDRLRSTPQSAGRVYTQLVIFPAFVLLTLVGIGSIAGFVFGDPRLMVALWPLGVFMAFTALGGATLVIHMRPPTPAGVMDTPETASLKFAWRVLIPPGVAIVGFVPVLTVRHEWQQSHDIATLLSHTNVTSGLAIAVSFLSLAWLRYGDQFREQMEQATVDLKDKKESDTATKNNKDAAGAAGSKSGEQKPVSKQQAKRKGKGSKKKK